MKKVFLLLIAIAGLTSCVREEVDQDAYLDPNYDPLASVQPGTDAGDDDDDTVIVGTTGFVKVISEDIDGFTFTINGETYSDWESYNDGKGIHDGTFGDDGFLELPVGLHTADYGVSIEWPGLGLVSVNGTVAFVIEADKNFQILSPSGEIHKAIYDEVASRL